MFKNTNMNAKNKNMNADEITPTMINKMNPNKTV